MRTFGTWPSWPVKSSRQTHPRGEGVRFGILGAHAMCPGKRSIGPHVSGLSKLLNCLPRAGANARDERGVSMLRCVHQGLYFRPFEMEFMVNADQPEMHRHFV